MLKIVKRGQMAAIISTAGSKAACEAEITSMANQAIGSPLPFLYSQGLPFSLLVGDVLDAFNGVPEIGESEAADIQAAFNA